MAKLRRACHVTPANSESGVPAKDIAGALVQEQQVQQENLEPEVAQEQKKERRISRRMKVNRDFDSKKSITVFSQADSARAYVDRYFINNVFKFTFVNRDRKATQAFVTSPDQFNKGMVNLKNKLTKELIDWGHFTEFPAEVFTTTGAKINPETGISYYHELMEKFQENFFGTFDIKQHPSKFPSMFNAFSAFYILNNFDDLVQDQLDGIVQIKMGNKGSIDNVSYAKESVGQSTIYWAQDDHESKNIEKFTSHLAKFIITTIPKVTEVGEGKFKQIGDQYLTASDLFMMAGILKQAEFEYNMVHAIEIGSGRLQPIVFNDNPKEALRRLLTEARDLPIMKQFGYDLTTSLRAFLYTDTAEEYSIHSLYNMGIKKSFDTLDIEQLLSFELNKNITPTYLEYDDNGDVSVRNYGKRYKASSRLDENLTNLVYFERLSPTPTLTKAEYDSIKGKGLDDLIANPANMFNFVCLKLFDIADTSLPQYRDFLTTYKDTILKICEALTKISDIKHSEDIAEYFDAVDEFAKTRVKSVRGISGSWKPMKDAANKFLSTIPQTTFDDLSGSSIPVYRLNSALFNYTQFIAHYKEGNPNRRKMNLFLDNPNILSRYNWNPYQAASENASIVDFTQENTYYETPAGFALDAGSSDQSSSIDKMHPNDQLYVSFLGNWLSLGKKGMFGSQIAPYSDKSSIGLIFPNAQALVFDPAHRDAKSAKLGRLVSLQSIINEGPDSIVEVDYFFRKNAKIDLINQILKAWNVISTELEGVPCVEYLTDSELTSAYKSLSEIPNKLLEEYEKLDKWLRNSKLDMDEVAKIATENGIELTENVFYASFNGTKSCNQALKWMLNNLATIKTFKAYESGLADKFLHSSEVAFLKNQVMRNRRKLMSGSNGEFFKDLATWNKDKKKFILNENKLNAELLKYHYANNLVRANYLELISKDAFADKGAGKFTPENKKVFETLEQKLQNNETLSAEEASLFDSVMEQFGRSEYSARVAGMAKRMVLYPATVENFTQNTLTGVSPMVHVAVIDDAKEEVFNLKGETHGQDIFDGAGFVSVYYSYMENNSLPGRGIKGTKKTLGVHTSDTNSALFKWAEFELNNDRIRRSRGNKYELFDLFKKMHDCYKIDPSIDLTKGLWGKRLNNPARLAKRRMFFREGFKDYEVTSLNKVEGSTYTVGIREVFSNGDVKVNKAGEPIAELRSVNISSIFDLWMAFGSYNAMELDSDGQLMYSDINNEAIAQYIYQVGTVKDYKGPLDQTNIDQPLRNLFISIVANKGAVKRGSSNILSAKAAWDATTPLGVFDVTTKNFGVQLDANHHADMAQLTEMSQTISALASNGHTSHYADIAYTAIGDIIRGSYEKVKNHVSDLEAGKVDAVIEKLSRSVVDMLQDEKTITTASALIKALADQSQMLLPLSDKRFYKLFAKYIFQDLNKSSLKRKYTGLGGVLNPSSNILQLYELNGKQYLFEDLVKLARKNFNASEQKVITDFAKRANLDLNKLISQLLITRSVNPETPLFIKSGRTLVLDPEFVNKYGKLPGYGLKEASKEDAKILGTVAYYLTDSDLNQAPIQTELTDINSYTSFIYNVNPSHVYINYTKPHDLRPQIESWSSEETLVNDLEVNIVRTKKDTWSEPSIFMLYNIERFLDDKKKRWKNDTEVTIAQNSTWFKMLRSFLNTQTSAENAEALLTRILNNDSVVKRQVKRMLEDLRMRASELRIQGLDFGALVTLPDGTGFDFNRYFGGYSIIVSEAIPEEAINIYPNLAKCIDYKVDPAEAILPKLYKSNFNFGSVNLADIDEAYFKKANAFYTSSLINSDGTHKAPIDFLVRTHTGNFNVVVSNKLAEVSDVYGTDITQDCRYENGWRLNEDGDRLYQVPSRGDFSIYIDENGVETLVLRHNRKLTNTLKLLFKSLNSNKTITPLVSVQPFLDSIAFDDETENYIDLCIENNQIKTHNDLLKKDKRIKGNRLKAALNGIYTGREAAYKNDLASTLYSSFVKTLEIISTRIPTQALQSFMAMHVAALTNDESNNVFVSRWQLWLQGSDLDIDKSYMMGVDVNKIGTYNHWSPIADFTSQELARISDELPLPSGIEVSFANNFWKYKNPKEIILTPNPEVDQLFADYVLTSNASDTTNLLDLQTKYKIKDGDRKIPEAIMMKIKVLLLNYINLHKDLTCSPQFQNDPDIVDLIDDLNRHNTHKLTAAESRNCVARAIRLVSLDGRNMLSGYSPIDRAMALFTDELSNHSFSQQLRNLDDTVSIFRIQYENAVGKQDVGIMANGLKAYFAMTQYFNHYWNSEEWRNSDRGRFFRTLKIGKLGDPTVQSTTRSTIADIKIDQEVISSLNVALAQIDPEAVAKGKQITESHDDASLLISSLVSLATDNAKELALAKLNAGINLACMHVFLTVMGYSAADIVNYTTSKLFQDLTTLITPSQFDSNAIDRVNDSVWKALYKKAETSKDYTLEDAVQLHHIYDCAQEMTTLAKLLGINQGMKVNEFIAAQFAGEFSKILMEQMETSMKEIQGDLLNKDGLLNAKAIVPELIRHLGLPNTSYLYLKYENKIADINNRSRQLGISLSDPVDMHRYFTDSTYREFIVDYYDIFKENFNIYDIINHSKHFYEMLNAFDNYLQVFTNSSSRAKWALEDARSSFTPNIVLSESTSEDEDGQDVRTVYYKVPQNYTEVVAKRISRGFDDYILSEFLLENSDYDFSLTLNNSKAKTTYNIDYGKSIKAIIQSSGRRQGTRQVRRNDNIAQFMNFVNNVLIPALCKQSPTNKFVQAIRPDLSSLSGKKKGRKTAVSWKFNFDIDQFNDPATASKYNDVVGGFDELVRNGNSFLTLQDVFPEASFSKGAEVKVGDILYLYDQIANFNSFGQGTLDRAFDRYISDSPTLPLQIAQIEIEHDRGIRQMSVDPHTLMAYAMRPIVANNYTSQGQLLFKDRNVNPIDVKNSYLLSLDSITTSDNDHYRKCARLIDAFRFNLVSIDLNCN